MTFRADRELILPLTPTETLTYTFNTSIIQSDAKTERRRPLNIEPIARFDLGQFTVSQEEAEEIMSFNQSSGATNESFLYQSSIDNTVTATGIDSSFDPNYQLIEKGVGVAIEGSTSSFFLFRSYELSYTPQAESFTGKTVALPSTHLDTKAIAKTGIRTPFVAINNLYFDTVLQDPMDYSINERGIVTHNTVDVTTVSEITWEGTYKFPVRFQTSDLAVVHSGQDLYTISGLVLIQERLDDALHVLTGNNYYNDFDFRSVNARLDLPLLPSNVSSYSLPTLRKELQNKVEKQTPFYSGTAETISIESTTITSKEKDYLKNFFLVMKGSLNSFYYEGEPKRYSNDSFSVSSVSAKNDGEQFFQYSSFSIESMMSNPLQVTPDTRVIGLALSTYSTEQFSVLNTSWEELRTTLNNGILSGGIGSVEPLTSSNLPYLQAYNAQRVIASGGTSQDLVLVYIMPSQDPVYYDATNDRRAITKRTNEPTSIWETDYNDYQTHWLLGDSLVILQVDLNDSTLELNKGQGLSDQLRDALRSRSVYDNQFGLSEKGAQIIKYLPKVPIDINLQSLLFGEFLKQEKRTEAIIMRITSANNTTYTNNLSLSNALLNPNVSAGLAQAAELANLAGTAGSTVTGGLNGSGTFDPTVGGCKVYLYDRINQSALEVVAIPGSPSTEQEPGQCPGVQYLVTYTFVNDFGTPDGFQVSGCFGPLLDIRYTLRQGPPFSLPPAAEIAGEVDCFTQTGVPQTAANGKIDTPYTGSTLDQDPDIQVDRVDALPDNCGDFPPFDPGDLEESGTQQSVDSSEIGQLLPDCVYLVDADTGEIYSPITAIANTFFFDYGFSTLDAIFTTGDNVPYRGQYGINSLATKNEVNLSTDNQSIDSIFNLNNILTPAKLAAGLLNGSTAEIYLVDWFDIPNSINDGIPILTGTIGKTKFDENNFSFEVRSLGEKLNKPVVRKTSPKCDYEFGGSQCLLDLSSNGLLIEATVATFDAPTRRITLTTSPLTTDFTFGNFLLVSGENAGLRLTISNFIAANELEYKGSLVEKIFPGQGIILRAFCAKDQNACKGYNNFVNFGGVPVGGNFVPSLNVITVP